MTNGRAAKGAKVFVAGIIQGSHAGPTIHDQDYRRRIKPVTETALPGAEVYCPFEHHPNSLAYDEERARTVFLEHVRMAAEADVVVAFLPEASMGTAIEMWEAHRCGRIILTISPLAENWVVKLLATRNFASLDEYEAFARSGQMAAMLDEHGNQ